MLRILYLAAFGFAFATGAQGTPSAEALFAQHCAMCHGATAQGDGPLAASLMIAPTDLTQLAAKADGIFPVIRVITRIDGRDPLASHGSPMPLWGQLFQGSAVTVVGPDGLNLRTSAPIAELLTYIEGLQTPLP